MSLTFYVFFFSSRRRHTRWPRDWSSDVCSSDLEPPEGISSVVSARRVWTEGMVIELVELEDSACDTVMAFWLDSSETSVITRRLIRPSLSTTGVKFSEMPNFL